MEQPNLPGAIENLLVTAKRPANALLRTSSRALTGNASFPRGPIRGYTTDAGVVIRERSPQAHRHADEYPVENSLAVAFIAMPRRFRGSDRFRTVQRSIRSPRRISRRIPFTHATRVWLDALGVPSIAFGSCRALRADTRLARIDRGGSTVALSSSLRWEALGASRAAFQAQENLAEPPRLPRRPIAVECYRRPLSLCPQELRTEEGP